MTPTDSKTELHVVRIGSTDHYSLTHPWIGGARTLCGIVIAGTPEAPYTDKTCAECASKAATR